LWIAQLQARSAELEQRTTPPPAFVKTNSEQKVARGARKKRDARHNVGRWRELASLRPVARLPLRTIQEDLTTLHQLHLSPEALAALRERCGHATASERAALLAQARASPVAHMDETGTMPAVSR
jgi:hypothetical protein